MICTAEKASLPKPHESDIADYREEWTAILSRPDNHELIRHENT